VNESLPRITHAACRQGAVLYFEDEAGVRSTAFGGRTWGRVGQTPGVSLTGKHFGVNRLSVVNAEGGLHFHLESKPIMGERFLDFLKSLTKSEPRPIFLILDRHPAHHATEVIDYVASHDDHLQFHFLPVYAPEINPAELVWHDLKKHKINKSIIVNPDSLRCVVNSSLRSLQRQVQKIRSFFHERHVRYVIGAVPCNGHQRRKIPGLSSPSSPAVGLASTGGTLKNFCFQCAE
jgi:transposase